MAKVLIVEDRESNRQLLRALLGYRNHEVVEARDGEEGIAMAIAHRPDLIITDILMPNVDGYEFLRRLRSEPAFERTPVIVYTATYVEEEAHALAVRCGVFRVIVRPVPPEDLLRATDEALQSTAPAPARPVVPDDQFGSEHRRLLTDKLAQKVAELEAEIVRREESEARLATALSGSGQRVLDWDLVRNIPTMTGSDDRSLQATPTAEDYERHRLSIDPHDARRLDLAMEAARKGQQNVIVQYRYRRSEGGERIAEMRGRFHYDGEGAPARLLGTVCDITDRVAEENERRLLAALVDHSLDMIGSSKPDGSLTFLNPAGRRLIGMDENQSVVGESMYRLIDPEDVFSVRNDVLPKLVGRGKWRGELRFLHQPTGDSIPCECACFAILATDGAIAEIAIIARDARARKESERQLGSRLAQLTALRRIDIAISGAVDLQLTLQLVINEVLAIDAVQSACIFTYDPHLRQLEFACGSGLVDDVRIHDLSERAVFHRKPLKDQNDPGTAPITELEALPLLAKGAVKGVLAVVYKPTGGPEHSLSNFIETIASQAAIAIDSAMLFEDLQRSKNDLAVAYDETLEGWSRALDLRDKETEGHSRRVTDLTMRIAREMRIPSEELQHIRRGALLHDIGKVGVPDSILLKPGPLTAEELVVMRKHADYALELLAPIAFLRPALDIPYCHHERWDGAGYPRGLKGTQIPLAARVFAVADVWDALSSDRPYRKAWPREKVIGEITMGSGTQFDPVVVSAFLRIVDDV